MLDKNPGVVWDDIAGLKFAKKSVLEIVVWPLQRPDLFKGLRGSVAYSPAIVNESV